MGAAGSAVSQGFDLEAVFRVTSEITLATAIGYNDAEFQETVLGGPVAAVPIISAGDSIPGSPRTFTANGQYDFEAFNNPAYVRFDYEYRAKGPNDTAFLNTANIPPGTFIDPVVRVRSPEAQLLALRVGSKLGNLDVSIYVKNLLNEHPNLSIADEAFFPGPPFFDPHNYSGETLTPRTVDLTVTYRN